MAGIDDATAVSVALLRLLLLLLPGCVKKTTWAKRAITATPTGNIAAATISIIGIETDLPLSVSFGHRRRHRRRRCLFVCAFEVVIVTVDENRLIVDDVEAHEQWARRSRQ